MDEHAFRLDLPDDVPLSLIERLDRLISSLPPGDPVRGQLLELRMEVADLEEMTAEARQTIEKLDAIVKKLSSPANRIGTYLTAVNAESAQIVVAGSEYLANADRYFCLPILIRNIFLENVYMQISVAGVTVTH